MTKKAKEKVNKKGTKDESVLNLDNEIIIGIKTLPEPKVPKQKKKRSNQKKKITSKTIQKGKKSQNIKKTNEKKSVRNNKKVQKKKEIDVEDELTLGIEEEKIKKKSKKTKNTKITKQQEMAIKKRKMIFRAVKYSILVTILISGGIYFMLSPFFYVKEITITGNTKVTNDEITSLAGINLEENTFKIQIGQVEKAIKQNAYIDKVNVKRKLPDKIEIEVIERTPTFMLVFANAYVYINNQGYLLEVSKTPINVPMITGFLTPEEDIHVGNRLCSEDLQRLDQALQIMKSAESNGIADLITKINISDKQNYILELEPEKKTVHMGDNSNLSTKMLFIISILEENTNIEGEIFVNTDLSNKGAIFRKKI